MKVLISDVAQRIGLPADATADQVEAELQKPYESHAETMARAFPASGIRASHGAKVRPVPVEPEMRRAALSSPPQTLGYPRTA